MPRSVIAGVKNDFSTTSNMERMSTILTRSDIPQTSKAQITSHEETEVGYIRIHPFCIVQDSKIEWESKLGDYLVSLNQRKPSKSKSLCPQPCVVSRLQRLGNLAADIAYNAALVPSDPMETGWQDLFNGRLGLAAHISLVPEIASHI
jgi:hypothetical protein